MRAIANNKIAHAERTGARRNITIYETADAIIGAQGIHDIAYHYYISAGAVRR